MTKEFEWLRLLKFDEYFEEQIYNKAEEYVFEFYNALSLMDLSNGEIESIKIFRDTLPANSFMAIGLTNVVLAAEKTKAEATDS